MVEIEDTRNNEENKNKELEVLEEAAVAASEKVFLRDVEWEPHEFGPGGKSYGEICPNGGPGGLICCDFCTKAYCAYLTQTAQDIEVQKTCKAGKEVKEISDFLSESRQSLDRAVSAARQKVPPLPAKPPEPRPAPKARPKTPTSSTGASTKRGRRSHAKQEKPSPMEFNLTSTIDINPIGPNAI